MILECIYMTHYTCGELNVRFFFFQDDDGIRDWSVTGVQTCALPIFRSVFSRQSHMRRGRIQVHENTVPGLEFSLQAARSLSRLKPELRNLTAVSYASCNSLFRSRSEERRVGKECRSRWGLNNGVYEE